MKAFNQWANAASVLHALGRDPEALAATNRALSIVPNSGYLHFLRGHMFQEAGNLTAAEQDYLQATKMEPNLVAPWSALAAFYQDLGDRMADVAVVSMSEFGRTARENGNRGTDHGHANVMFVMGGDVQGGKVYGEWPGLAEEQLNEGRDLALTTDFRQVIGEAVARHMGNKNLQEVFPNYQSDPTKFLKFL